MLWFFSNLTARPHGHIDNSSPAFKDHTYVKCSSCGLDIQESENLQLIFVSFYKVETCPLEILTF